MTGTLSTIDVTVPAQGAQLLSGPVRGNFLAASNDINNLYGIVQSGTGIGTQSITYSQIQAEGTQTLLGNPWGTSQSPAEIKLGASLTFVTGSLQTVAMTNDVVSPANSLAGTIAAGAVTNAKFRNSVGLSIVGNAGTVTGTIADIVGVNNQVLTITGSVVQFGAVPAGAGGFGTTSLTPHNIVVGNGTNPPALIPPVASGNILLDQGAGTNAAFFAMVGDASIVNTGTISVTRVNAVTYQGAGNTANRVAIVSSAGTVTYGTVPNAAIANPSFTVAGQIGTIGGGTVGLASVTGTLAAAVTLTTTGSFADGPSVTTSGTGVYACFGNVTLIDPNVAASFIAKLWDGTNIAGAGVVTASGAGGLVTIALNGTLLNPSGGIVKMSVRDFNGTLGTIAATNSGFNVSNVTAVRIG